MIVALSLLAYAVLLATVVSRRLAGAAWTARAPRLAVAAWQGLTVGVLTATVLGAVALAVPTVQVSADLAALLDACVMALQAQYSTPGGAAVAATGSVLAFAVIVRVGWITTATVLRTLRERHGHRDALAVLGRADRRLGVTVVDDERPAAYCLPGRRRRVVVTSGALSALDDAQLTAVLAHEREHLRGRHHLALTYADALARAFPRLPVFRRAASETARLIEMCADDAATAATGRFTVAEALLVLACAPSPAPALGAGGATTPDRIRRLIDAPAPLRRRQRLIGLTGIGALLLFPLVIAAGPAAAATGMNYCPTKAPSTACPYGPCQQ